MRHALRGRVPPLYPTRYDPLLWHLEFAIGGLYGRPASDVAAPDLEEALAAGAVPAHVLACLDALASHPDAGADRTELEALRAFSAAGDLLVALSLPHCNAEVTPRDVFIGGVALRWRADLGRLTVAPRLLRLVCGNGQVLPMSRTLDSRTYTWTPESGASGTLEAALDCGLSGRPVAAAVVALEPARRVLVEDPPRALLETRVPFSAARRAEVLGRFARRGDRSWYGLLNAVTESARDAADLRTRLALEQAAGRLLARFPRSRPLLAATVA